MARSGGAWMLRRVLGAALEDLEVCLCLHRVLPRCPDASRAAFNHPPDLLDGLVEVLLASRPGAKSPWLMLAFDDGYADAAEWVASRAPALPAVRFLFFVCPEKTELRAGFRWDAPELSSTTRQGLLDGVEENRRPELVAAAATGSSRLATVAEVRALAQFPNVILGNHTNVHLPVAQLSFAQAERELVRSKESFERLFGPQLQFAFPFGTPGSTFDKRHVALLRALGTQVIWSTEPRPFLPDERAPGALLPRLAVDGRRSLFGQAMWIAQRALSFRARGPRFHCPPITAPATAPVATPAQPVKNEVVQDEATVPPFAAVSTNAAAPSEPASAPASSASVSAASSADAAAS